MGRMWIWLLACSNKANPEPAHAEPTTQEARKAPDCSALESTLARLAQGEEMSGLNRDDAGRVQVVIEPEVDGLPDSFEEELRAGGMVQGWSAPGDLCQLAATPGVTRVRPPAMASPK